MYPPLSPSVLLRAPKRVWNLSSSSDVRLSKHITCSETGGRAQVIHPLWWSRRQGKAIQESHWFNSGMFLKPKQQVNIVVLKFCSCRSWDGPGTRYFNGTRWMESKRVSGSFFHLGQEYECGQHFWNVDDDLSCPVFQHSNIGVATFYWNSIEIKTECHEIAGMAPIEFILAWHMWPHYMTESSEVFHESNQENSNLSKAITKRRGTTVKQNHPSLKIWYLDHLTQICLQCRGNIIWERKREECNLGHSNGAPDA